MLTRTALAGFLAATVLGTGLAAAQEKYPSRTITIVVPTSPGAVTDVIARAIAHAMSEKWGQQAIVDNRPGANELIGTTQVTKSKPDGHTLLITSNASITSLPHLHKNMPFDPQKDLTPLFMLGQVTPVMVVPAKSQVKSVQDLVALAKQKPGALNYGSFGVGAYSHIAMEDFMRRTGIQMMHLPHRGATPAYTAMLRNETVAMFANLASARGHEEAGSVRIIAAAGPKRSSIRPELATVAESGVPGFSTGAWWGLFGPANMPPEVVAKIRGDMTELLNTPTMKKIFAVNTMERPEMTSDEFKEFIRKDTEYWAEQIKIAGLEPK